MSVHLIGGGRDGELGAVLLRPFVEEAVASAATDPVVAMLLVLEPGDTASVERFADLLSAAGAPAGSIRPLIVIEGERVAPEALHGIDALFVGGGLTPAYLDAVQDAIPVIRDRVDSGMPYAGFSAGAAIAPVEAIVGGYRVDGVTVCPEDAGEELDEVEVRPGLGIVPFSVDVHAAQWGTLSRLIAAAAAGRIAEGAAIDEHTSLVIAPGAAGDPVVQGAGRVWRAVATGAGVTVEPLAPATA